MRDERDYMTPLAKERHEVWTKAVIETCERLNATERVIARWSWGPQMGHEIDLFFSKGTYVIAGTATDTWGADAYPYEDADDSIFQSTSTVNGIDYTADALVEWLISVVDEVESRGLAR